MTVKRPDGVLFADLMTTWAQHVTESFVWLVDRDPGIAVVEAWTGDDFHLHVRYRAGGRLLGVRLGRLNVDPTSGFPLDPTARDTSSASSAQVASQLYHGGFATGPDQGSTFWRDPLGHDWWGEPPAGGWARISSARKE